MSKSNLFSQNNRKLDYIAFSNFKNVKYAMRQHLRLFTKNKFDFSISSIAYLKEKDTISKSPISQLTANYIQNLYYA